MTVMAVIVIVGVETDCEGRELFNKGTLLWVFSGLDKCRDRQVLLAGSSSTYSTDAWVPVALAWAM